MKRNDVDCGVRELFAYALALINNHRKPESMIRVPAHHLQ